MSVDACAVCQTTYPGEGAVWLDLGVMPFPNRLRIDPVELVPKSPVRVWRCAHCGHSQLTDSVLPDGLYAGYPYRSRMSGGFGRHCLRLAREAVANTHATAVLDIGANDGTMLLAFLQAGLTPEQVTGVDIAPCPPAGVLSGRMVVGEFPSPALAGALPDHVDVVTCLNTLNAVREPDAVIADVARRLSPEGLFIIQVPYLVDLVRARQFDLVYQEHRHYWLAGPLQTLLLRHGLEVFDVDHVELQGGSIVVLAGHQGAYPYSRGLVPWGYWEAVEGFLPGQGGTPTPYDDVQYALHRLRCALAEALRSGRWYGYGAAAKGSVLMATCGLGERVGVVIDDTPEKQGKCTSWGARIEPATVLGLEPPDGVIIFAWNVADEILARLRETGWHGPVLIPRPDAVQTVAM